MDNVKLPHFSFYKKGYMQGDKAYPQNRPSGEYTLQDVYGLITGESLRNQTEEFRKRKFGRDNASRFKLVNFPAVTFSATFTYRNEAGVKEVNNLLVLDFDDVGDEVDVMRLKRSLLSDECFDTQLLFVSPSGRGVKWVIEVEDWCGMSRAEFFRNLCKYIESVHGHGPDPSGKDVARLCFLCYDAECFINPIYLKNHE